MVAAKTVMVVKMKQEVALITEAEVTLKREVKTKMTLRPEVTIMVATSREEHIGKIAKRLLRILSG